MTSRRMTLVLLGSALVVTGSWACGSSTATTTGPGGATTTVSSTSGSSVIATGTGGSAGGGGGSSGNLGLACMQDSDCGGSLRCVLPTANDPVFGGGPANGYCSQSCQSGSDCPGTGSICLTPAAGGTGDCIQGCTLGPALVHINDPLNPDKCQGREDVRCLSLSTPDGGTLDGCIPTCGEDSQCPTGEVCDPRLAVCVPTANVSTGLPNGSACDPNATNPQCAAECVSFLSEVDGGPMPTLCTNPCVLGGEDIATNPNCGGDTKGICAYSPEGNGAGDFGYCAPACTSQSDCQPPVFFCFPVSGLTGMGAGMIPNGYCFGATPCPNGASDCASQAGTTCTQTSGGPLCISNMYPLPMPDGGTDGGEDGGGTGGSDAGTGGTDGGTDAGAGGGTGGGDGG